MIDEPATGDLMPANPPPGPGKAARTAALVRRMIHDGRLAEGDPLPSTRGLAAELGVSRGTVVAAYEQLDGEGYLHTRQGAVSRVAATLSPAAEPGGTAHHRADATGRPGASSTTARLPASTAATSRPGPSSETRRTASPPFVTSPPAPPSSDIIDLTPGLPQATALTSRDWRAALRHAAAVPLTDTFPDSAGHADLRTQIAAHLALGRGFAPDPDRVLLTSGTAEAVSLLTETSRATTAGRGPRIAVENPGYGDGRAAIVSGGGELVAVPVDDDGLRLDELQAAHAREPLCAVMVTPSHQYPMGGVMPVARRQELCDWAAREGVLVIEDDYDSEFRHRGAPLPALAAMDAGGAVVHVGTFSKVLDPHLRCGYLVLPRTGPHTESILTVRRARGPAVATVLQHTLTHLMATGALRRHIARCRREYAHRRTAVIDTFAGARGVRLRATDGGLHAVLVLTGDAGAGAALAARLAERGIRVADLQRYVVPGLDPVPQGIVLGYGATPTTTLRRALRIIRAETTTPTTP